MSMSELKYIRFEDIGFVIFEPGVEHDVMAKLVGAKPVSAGFATFPDTNGNPALCSGKSVSLKLASSPADTAKLQRLTNPYSW